jgi:LysR family transcriptional regulator, glycine cleavage system transcriptional activator
MNKLPPLIELRAFEAAARHLSFKKAAAELGVTPTAISHQIRLLEQYCGKALFRRKPRPVSLTEAGVRLFPVVRDGLESFATALGTIRRKDDRQALRITTTNAFAARWLVPRLPHWRKQHPLAPLDITGTDSVLDLLAGDADVAIRYATSRQVPREGIVEEFLSDNYWPVCSPDLLPAGGRLKNAADLRKQVLVHSYWFPSDIEPPSWQRWFSIAKRNWRNLPDFTDMQHLSFREELHAIEAVVAGQGVGMFSDVLVAAELTSGALVKVFNLSLPGYRFYVVRKPGHPREKIIRAFSAWLLSVR